MNEKLSWLFELLDKFSGPAKGVVSSFDKVRKAATQLRDAQGRFLTQSDRMANVFGSIFGPKLAGQAKSLFKAFGSAGEAIGPVIGVIGTVGSVAAGAAATLGAITLGAAALGGKWMVESLTFKENTLTAFRAMLGTQEAADRVFAKATKFAAETPFETKDVVEAYQQLLGGGFKESELDKLMLAMGDVGAARGTEAMKSAIRAISQIQAKGRLQAEELMQLSESGGVGQAAVWDALAKKMGKTREEVMKLGQAGKITADQGIAAIQEAIAKTVSGGELGNMMKSQSRSLTGLWSTLMSAPFDLLMKANMGGGLDKIKDFIIDLTKAVSPDGPAGKRIIAFFELVGTTVGQIFDRVGGGKDIGSVLLSIIGPLENIVRIMGAFATGTLVTLMNTMKPVMAMMSEMGGKTPEQIEQMTKAWERMGAAFGFFIGQASMGFLLVISYFEGMIEAFSAGYDWLKEHLDGFSLGSNLVMGFINGMLAMVPGVGPVVAGIGEAAKQGLSSFLEIGSPSKVFEELGANTVAGFLGGIMGGVPSVAGAVGGLVQTPTAASFGGATAAMAAGSTFNAGGITVSVMVQGADAKDPAATGNAIAKSVQESLVGTLGKFALEAGL